MVAVLVTIAVSISPKPSQARAAQRTQVAEPKPTLRIGLLDALQRRARFTRAHHGPVASVLAGDTRTSSSFPASWYTADRVYFAWQQGNAEIIATAFNRAGMIAVEPTKIGTGQYPILTADDKRVAVAWPDATGRRFSVRVNDGNGWSNDIPLPGAGAALVFATRGPLYAATSMGLWKLDADRFNRIQHTGYSEPSTTVDKNGQPHIAWVQSGHVMYDGTDLGAGEQPSLLTAANGTTYLACVSGDMLVVRNLLNGQWTAPDTVAVTRASRPTLALDDGGHLRLSYIAPAEYGPDATWLIRLPDKQPIMLPSVEGSVTDAFLSTSFDLRQPRNYFRHYDLLLSFNDVDVRTFENTVPEGRYLFRLDPNQVFTSNGAPVPNRVAIHSWHMNGGHYAANTGYQLTVRMEWSEHYVFAASDDDARRATPGERVNHDQPDLGVFANAASLPVEMPRPSRLNIPIMIANLGEVPSRPTRLLMSQRGSGRILAEAEVPSIKPGEQQTFAMPLDYAGERSIDFRLENNSDFDVSNDALNLVLWESHPTRYVGPDPTYPNVPLELKITVGGQPAGEYEILDAPTDRPIAKVVNGEQFGRLGSGKYHVAVKPFQAEGQKVVFTEDISHQAGTVQQVDFNSGIKIQPPEVAGRIWRWSATRAADPNETVQWQSGGHSLMALPPDDYLVELEPSSLGSQTIVWPQKIQVQAGQQVTLKIDSSVRLDVPPEAGTVFQWWLVPAGRSNEIVQQQRGGEPVMIVPPGVYQIAIRQSPLSQNVLWPQQIQVQPGTQTPVQLHSGIRLTGPGASANYYVQVLDVTGRVLQWWQGTAPQLLPPGNYVVEARPDTLAPWTRISQSAEVRPEGFTQVNVPTPPPPGTANQGFHH